MKKNLVKFAVLGLFVFASCAKGFDTIEPEPTPTPEPTPDPTLEEEIKANVTKVFGVTFDPNHDWNSTTSGSITISVNSTDVEKVQLLAYTEADFVNEFNEKETSLTVLNEADVKNQSTVTLYYDAPKSNELYAAFITKNDFILKKVEGSSVSYSRSAKTRTISTAYTLPTTTPKIEEIIPSYANERGWIEGQMLYGLSDYNSQKMEVNDYENTYKTLFNNYAFSFFKNGRNYNNLPIVIGTGMYNETGYPLTTGSEPILISPIFKQDGGSQYGDEVLNSDLYYYYFKESDLNGMDKDATTAYLNALPKYKAFPFANEYTGLTEKNILKKYAYALIYWGDGTPTEGSTGTYQFPAGYKIGFMVRAKTTHKENGKPRKQGELYGDGRLNNFINSYSECNFKSSELGEDGPRQAWLRINGKQIICFESGTDKDFNDIFLEIEGGIYDMFYTPNLTANTYTYCFEDRDLGDYDMNDIVIKATRSGNQVTYSIVACGAYDELYIKNINAGKIKDNAEIHKLFGKTTNDFINTDESLDKCEYITATKTVSENFSFLDDDTRPYIYNKTTGKNIYIAKVGEDPHAIMIPNDFKYPKEKQCIKGTYADFNSWGQNPITKTEWYTNPTEGTYYNK